MSKKSDAADTPHPTAPSPADAPTVEAPTATPGESDRPVGRETDERPGGGSGAIAEAETVPTSDMNPTRTSTAPSEPGPGRTRIGGMWIGLILGAIVLIFLLIFILQNLDPADVQFLGLRAELPLGIWMLFSAIAGVLLLAIPGLGRMLQWRRASRGRSGRR